MPPKPKAPLLLAAAIVLTVIAAACLSGLLRADSAASWAVGVLFIDELIIIALIVAAVLVAAFDGKKIRTLWNTKR